MGDDYYKSPIFRCGSMEEKQLDELRKLHEELMKMGVRTYHDLLTPNAPVQTEMPKEPSEPSPEMATVDEVRREIQNLISCQESALREFEGKKKRLFKKLLSAMKTENIQKSAGLRIFSGLNDHVKQLRNELKRTNMDKPFAEMLKARAQQQKLVPGGAAKRGAN